MKDPVEVHRHRMYVECSCGCCFLEVGYWEDEGYVFLSHNESTFQSLQDSWLERARRAAKMIWAALRGKEYCHYELTLRSKAKIEEFKAFVAAIDTEKMAYE